MGRRNFSHIFPDIGREGKRWGRAATFDVDCMKGPVASTTADAAPFLLSGSGAAVTIEDASADGGVAKALSSSTNPLTLQGNGEPFSLASGRDIVLEARMKLADVDGMSFFVGLGITDTTPWATSFTDWAGFFCVNSATLSYGSAKNGSDVPGSGSAATEESASTGVTLVDNTWFIVHMLILETNRIKFYVNQTYVGQTSTVLPDDEALTPTIAFIGSAETVYFDYVIGCMDRDFSS